MARPTPKPTPKPTPRATPRPTPTPAIPATPVGALLKSKSVRIGRSQIDATRLRLLYQSREYNSLFTDSNGVMANALVLRSTLTQAPLRHGLRVSDYWNSEMESRWSSKEPGKLAELDVLLANALIQYASDLATGRTNPQDDVQNLADFEMKKRTFRDYAGLNALATDAASLAAGLESHAPQDTYYRRLSAIVVNLQNVKSRGGWPELKKLKTLKPGASDPNVPLIRMRLIDLGVMLDAGQRDNPSQVYDADLKNAVEWFQYSQKLETNGFVGSGSFRALMVPIDTRIDQLRANLERWRLLPRSLGSEYIFVDLGQQEFRLVKDGAVQLSMRVVVGQPLRQTPSFVDQVTDVIVNPYWNAPASIVVKDILPKAMQNPYYFSELKMRVFDRGREIDPTYVDWSQYSLRYLPPFQFREDPGDHNSLGRLKFNLSENSHDIYMHDTNRKELFAKATRLFSSGCIRLEKPRELAQYFLGPAGIGAGDLENLINDPGVIAKNIKIPRPIPVYVVGLTNAIEPSGVIRYGEDIYGQDARFAGALNGAPLKKRPVIEEEPEYQPYEPYDPYPRRDRRRRWKPDFWPWGGGP